MGVCWRVEGACYMCRLCNCCVVQDLVWSRHQLEELAERRFRAAQVRGYTHIVEWLFLGPFNNSKTAGVSAPTSRCVWLLCWPFE